AIERVNRRPSATAIRLGDEADAVGILEQQWRAEALGRVGRFGSQSLRQVLEIVGEGVCRAVVHAADRVGETGDGRIAFGDGLKRKRAIVVVLCLVEARFEIEILILEGMRQLVREQHLADNVALNHELSRAVPDAKIGAAFDENHFLAMWIVKARHLALEQLERRGLQIEPRRIEPGQRAGNGVNLELVVRVVAHKVSLHHGLRLVRGLDDERNRLLEAKLAKTLDAGLDSCRLLRIDLVAVDERVGASAQKNQRADSTYWPPEPSCEADGADNHSVTITTDRPNLAAPDARASAAERVANAPMRTR